MKLMMISLLLIFALILVLPLASSSIFIEPLKSVYNYGDQINVQTKIAPSLSSSGHYIVDLKCGVNFTSNIFNSFFDLRAGAEKEVLVATELLDPMLFNMEGPCYLKASFGNDVSNSNSFTLSREIVVDAELEFESLAPGNTFYISGTAVKKSGVSVNGFAELFIPSLNLYKSALVTNGLFNITLLLPSDVKSGTHNFTIEIHNTDYNSRKINFGSYSDVFSVSQVLKEVKIYADSESIKPESELIFRIDAFDQAGDPINKEVSLIVNKPKGIPFIKKVIKSGEDQKINFFINDTPGYWSIETDVDGISNRKLFYLSEVNTLQTSLINNTLIVTNIGNAPYSGPLEVSIGSFVEIKQIKLKPGETDKFTLRAPDGDYSISVLEAGEIKNLGSAFLTGNAVKVTDFKEDVIYTFTNPWIWAGGIILFILIIVLVQIKVRMQNSSKAHVTENKTDSVNIKPAKAEFAPVSKPTKDISLTQNKFDMSWLNKPAASSAVSNMNHFSPPSQKVSPVNLFQTENHGIRERAVSIALYFNSNSDASETMNMALNIAKEQGAKLYADGDYKIILFSPRLTNNHDNENAAINVARRMQALFLEQMKINKIMNFGIGITDGEIISEIENNKFHFTSTGNLISYAKRLAYSSNSKLFVSDSIIRKVIGNVKTEKTSYAGVWEVVRIADRSQSDFIKRFSERNK